MFKKALDYTLACQYLPSSVRDFLPWDTEQYITDANGERVVKRKSAPLPLCRHCGLCLTGSECPLTEKRPMEK